MEHDNKTQRYNYGTDLLRQVGHDLKSPLTAIIGALEAIVSFGDRLSADQIKILCQTGLKEAHRLQHFIQNILLLSKLEHEGVPVSAVKMTLQDVLPPLLERARQLHPHVTWEVSAADGFGFSGDQKWLSEILWQVMDNTGRHNPQPVTAVIKANSNEGKAQITVADNGVGIAPELRQTAFEKHIKGATTEHQDASAGVGLTIARLLTQAQGGQIQIANNDNQGAAIVIELQK